LHAPTDHARRVGVRPPDEDFRYLIVHGSRVPVG